MQARLALLKQNLQRSTTAQDDYLCALLDQAEQELQGMGLKIHPWHDMLVADYAAFLFRCRADMSYDHVLPRYLDRRIKNELWHQKGAS